MNDRDRTAAAAHTPAPHPGEPAGHAAGAAAHAAGAGATDAPRATDTTTAPASPAPESATLAHRALTRMRLRIAASITALTSSNAISIDYAAPPGDPGLFGPDAVCWKVHADFTAMMVGGISALLLQALHPLALAGVWDHSSFRSDIHGRLRRTATFIAGTTYGSRADALALIERVKAIHRQVRGHAPDGRAYAADDPALLTWVHVAEVSSFLAGYLRYVNPQLSLADQDRYYGETALIAELLGARAVPRTRAEIAAYLQAMRGELEVGPRTREVVKVLMNARAPSLATRPVGKILLGAGVDLLPPWAQRSLGFAWFAPWRAALVRPAVRSLAPLMRWALRNGVSKRARARVAAGASAPAVLAAGAHAAEGASAHAMPPATQPPSAQTRAAVPHDTAAPAPTPRKR